MTRPYHLIAVLGLPLLTVGCNDGASPPSAPTAIPTAQAATPALARSDAVSRTRFQVRQLVAETFFSEGSGAGCVLTDVLVFAAERAEKAGSGKPVTGPLVFIDIDRFDICTEQSLRRITGTTREVTFQADRNKLSNAVLRATIPATDLINNVEVQVQVNLTWSAIGGSSYQAGRTRDRSASRTVSSWLRGKFQDAIVSGTVTFGRETLAPATASGQIYRATIGELDVERTR
jgi:hypothetical protein